MFISPSVQQSIVERRETIRCVKFIFTQYICSVLLSCRSQPWLYRSSPSYYRSFLPAKCQDS